MNLVNRVMETSSNDQMAEGNPLNEQNLGAFGIDSIEYADHGQSPDCEDDTYCRRWGDEDVCRGSKLQSKTQ